MSLSDDFLKDTSSAVLEAAAEIGDLLSELLPIPEGPESKLFEAMRYAVLAPGKRIRPVMVLASASIFSVPKNSALRVAAAVEMVHTYSLLHDDLPCMDDDDLRRGQLTTHIKYDQATAVLAGDALLTLAFEIIAHSETHSDPHVRSELCFNLAKAIGGNGMVGGQAIDISIVNSSADLGTITRSHQLKTGALITFACESGAILSSAPQKLRNALHAFAHDLGLAFQIIDDLLDSEGDVEDLGKDTKKDEALDKATFVSLLGVERSRTQAELLLAQSIQHLEPFGTDANFLKKIGKFVLERKH